MKHYCGGCNIEKEVSPLTLLCKKCSPNRLDNNEQQEDIINKPNHYHAGGVDVVTFMKGKTSPNGEKGFYQINVIKYVSRYNLKNGLEDLKKAQWNLNELIKMEETND